MTSKPITDAELIAAYRSGAAARRRSSIVHKDRQSVTVGVTQHGGVVTVELPANAQSISALGGRAAVLGESSISIPEFQSACAAAVPADLAAPQK